MNVPKVPFSEMFKTISKRYRRQSHSFAIDENAGNYLRHLQVPAESRGLKPQRPKK